MASTFMGLSIANRGLASSQTGLSVTTNNISNVNTTGYSRQTVTQVAIGPAAVYSGNNYVGSGSDVTSVDRVRSFRLDQKYWRQNSAQSEWDGKSTYLTEIEEYLSTSSTDTVNLSTELSNFNTALENLSSDPGSDSARSVVVDDGTAICEWLNNAADNLTQARSDINSDVKTTVEQINSYSQQIADLNQKISVATASGSSANDLEDQRDLLIDKLSALAGIEVTQTTTGTAADGTDVTNYNISINGATLVSGNNARQLECYTISDGSDEDGMYGIRWADTGDSFDPGDSGSLKAELDVRDGTGNDGEYKGILYYMDQLNTFAQTFAKAFNEGVTTSSGTTYSGYVNGYGSDASTGNRFFSYNNLSSDELQNLITASGTDAVYAKITAANISLTSDVQDNPREVAAASASGEKSNNENVKDLISICEDSVIFNGSSPTDYYKAFIGTLGADTSYASQQYNVQSAIASYIDDSRSSVSGVSTNEETVNMTKYQEAYEASASAVTTWSNIYQTTIDMVSD